MFDDACADFLDVLLGLVEFAVADDRPFFAVPVATEGAFNKWGLGVRFLEVDDEAVVGFFDVIEFVAEHEFSAGDHRDVIGDAFDFFEDEVRSAEPFFAVLAALGRTGLLRTHEVPRVRGVLDTLGALRPGDILPGG